MVAKFFKYLQMLGIVPNLASLCKKVQFYFKSYKVSIREKVSSYTTVNHVVVESTLWVHAVPFIIDDKKYLRLNTSRWTAVKTICAIGSLVIQLTLILKWFQIQKSKSRAVVFTDSWRQILMTFFLDLFIGACFGLLHLLRVPREIVFLLNCSNYLERDHQGKGVHGYVPNYFIGIAVLAIITVTAAPVTLCATGFLKPCMPPSFFTMATLPCKDWNDIRGYFLAKTVQAVFAAYTGLVIFSTLAFGLFVLLYYPVAVQLLLLDGLKRYLDQEKSFRMILLVQYRKLQLLSRLLNNAWRDPAMPFVVGGILVLNSTSLYVVLSSSEKIPLPVLAIYSVGAVDTLVMIQHLFKIVSYPYTRSVDFINAARRGLKKASRWEVKYIVSCFPLKVHMGNGTFFDRSTSLVVCNTALDLLVTFLLL
ncbi:Cytochrome c biogenesis protein CcsA [Folsomia candida]|uniref:Cytochrome c biogenesis protein CcsA n=1 Tax=Folsomia candida TaxID=158441 RepID=A0A226DL16_FOLCA|nr:Cytochrome c biogenesis protein CcsA [Folsomia candida]